MIVYSSKLILTLLNHEYNSSEWVDERSHKHMQITQAFQKVCLSAIQPLKMAVLSFQSVHEWMKDNDEFSLGM